MIGTQMTLLDGFPFSISFHFNCTVNFLTEITSNLATTAMLYLFYTLWQ